MDKFHRWEAPLQLWGYDILQGTDKNGLQSQFMSLWRTFDCKWSKEDNVISAISEEKLGDKTATFLINAPKPQTLAPPVP